MVKFDPNLHFRSVEELNGALLFSRQEGCVDCANVRSPSCPRCPSGEVCSLTIPSCNQCARAICIEDDTAPNGESRSNEGGPNTGAIAGGVVGGVVVIAVLSFLVWKFCVKPKRRQLDQEPYGSMSDEGTGVEKDHNPRRDHRTSVHTVHSIASTVLTRASNIIQIAYIPGVTNRATPTSPNVLVPPVPPIPMHAANSAANSPSYEDQHFFMPGDLRNSTYSGLSQDSDRQSYARGSYAHRSSIAPSIASTIYGKNAVVVAPAQTGMRAKAAMVSVKSIGGSTGSGASTPPVPSIDFEKYEGAGPRDSTFSVGSTFLNNASTATATPARAQVVRLGSGNQVKQVSVGTRPELVGSMPRSPGTTSTTTTSTNIRDSNSTTVVGESPAADQGPFSDPPSSPGANKSTTSLSAVIEEATRRAASGPDRRSKRHSTQERGASPFDDEHATRD
ncbi:hypothetical protein SODALDRAFT_364152 [Sodiomyces alkalinus F11]|uniref:Membrane anchor Opy2 N-terminal domain-containing protein n=1 Tax=Sodiomyces alkalinus (strain CBS 110278 / VKM F-3762 / F11) TaxID=1314773 RepID=A0A3N2PJP5_SODAK|nr:hypothetical protein SODALDRAFT_364152 [Sodiomyces alkalinus F11]ROT34650.1 hypothetical protein SODALDRAFT_364152 [Sodiomyces alkalinus F11]